MKRITGLIIRYSIYWICIIVGIITLIAASVRTSKYNSRKHEYTVQGSNLYNEFEKIIDVSAEAKIATDTIELSGMVYNEFEISLDIKNESINKFSGYGACIEIDRTIYIPLGDNTGLYKLVLSDGRSQNVDFSLADGLFDIRVITNDSKKYVELLEGDLLFFESAGEIGYEEEIIKTLKAYSTANDDFILSASSTIEYDLSSHNNEKVSAMITYSKGDSLDLIGDGILQHYPAAAVSYSVENDAKHSMRDLFVQVVISSPVLLTAVWDGSIEIHQFKSGVENIAYIDNFNMLRSYSDDDLKMIGVTAVKLGTDVYITLNSGDYIFYSASDNAKSIPKGSNYEFGFMYLYPESSVITNYNVYLTYKLHRNLSNDASVKLGSLLLLVFLVIFVSDVIIEINIFKMRRKAVKDEVMLMETMNTFTGFIDAKDSYTNGHSGRVAEYARILARELGMNEEEAKKVYFIALLHDCGKIGVPDAILNKPAKLTDVEYNIIKSHTVKGAEILSKFKSIDNIRDGALYHHERYDGKGYPYGLKGTMIPFVGRLICICDALDAMNSDRCYRKRLPKDIIIRELEMGAGKQFDPTLSDVMIKIIVNGKIKTSDGSEEKTINTNNLKIKWRG